MTPELLRSLFEKGIKVTKLEMSEPTLDEVYLELTGRRLRDDQASWEEIFSMRRTIRRARA